MSEPATGSVDMSRRKILIGGAFIAALSEPSGGTAMAAR
jgi:hypothetical protein